MVRIESCSARYANPIREQPYNTYSNYLSLKSYHGTVIFNQLLYAGMNPGEYFPTALQCFF